MPGGKIFRETVDSDTVQINADLRASFTDLSGTPGAGVFATPRGRIALPAGTASLIITNPLLGPMSLIVIN